MHKVINLSMNKYEYVTVNQNQDLLAIDYDDGIARYIETVTLDDLKVNNEEYTDLGEFSIYEYLESNEYEILLDECTETEIYFYKRTFINLKKESA